jgi:hypothetical protein
MRRVEQGLSASYESGFDENRQGLHLAVSGMSDLRGESAEAAALRFVMDRLSSSHTGIPTAISWFLDSNGKAQSYAAYSLSDDGSVASHLRSAR